MPDTPRPVGAPLFIEGIFATVGSGPLYQEGWPTCPPWLGEGGRPRCVGRSPASLRRKLHRLLGRRAVALYFLDWDNGGRVQEVELLDGPGTVRDRFTVEQFANGKYLVIGLKGYARIRIRRISGQNAWLSGIFFDPAPAVISAGTPLPLKNASISNGRLKLTAIGFEDERFCLDASTDLRTWSCVLTNSFTTQTLDLDIAVDPGPSHFHRAHIVP